MRVRTLRFDAHNFYKLTMKMKLTAVIEHVILRDGIPVRSSLGQIRVDTPTESQLTCRLLEWTESQNWDGWSLLGCSQDGGSTKREADNGFSVDCLADLSGSHNHGIRGCVSGRRTILFQQVSVMTIAFDAVDDALLHANALFGILSSGTLGGKHNGIGAVINGSRHVTGFRTSGRGGVNHGFEHLCGHHHGSALSATFINDLFLQQWNIFGWAVRVLDFRFVLKRDETKCNEYNRSGRDARASQKRRTIRHPNHHVQP